MLRVYEVFLQFNIAQFGNEEIKILRRCVSRANYKISKAHANTSSCTDIPRISAILIKVSSTVLHTQC